MNSAGVVIRFKYDVKARVGNPGKTLARAGYTLEICNRYIPPPLPSPPSHRPPRQSYAPERALSRQSGRLVTDGHTSGPDEMNGRVYYSPARANSTIFHFFTGQLYLLMAVGTRRGFQQIG